MAGTIPADLAQDFAHVMRVEQKLAYLYGWQSFLNEDDEVDDETVAQVYQKGYRMGDRVIRTAMVTVTYGGPKRPAEQADDADANADAEKDES